MAACKLGRKAHRREAFVDRRSRTDHGVRRVDLVTTPAGQSGTLEIAGDGEARLAMHAICRMPVPRN